MWDGINLGLNCLGLNRNNAQVGNTEPLSPSVRVGCSVGDKTKDIIQKPYENS